MGTLYECLREARLEQFYPAFRANGITRSEALINLGMPEFCALGITSSEDKRRLVELVNIIRSVHNSGLSESPTSQRRNIGGYQQSSSGMSAADGSPGPGRGANHAKGRTRSSSRAASHENVTSAALYLEASRDVIVQDRVPNFSVASYMDMLQYMSESSESEDQPVAQTVHRNVSSPNTVRSSSARGLAVERIRHSKGKGYNYGVHKVSTPNKPKTVRSGSHRSTGEEKIKVCVRKRPLTRQEQKAKEEDIVKVESTNTLTVNEPKLAVDLTAFTLQHEFIFDEIFDESCTNEDVYIRAARPLISCIFNGGTATCFAYGQTGAGKTHTMLGNENVPGLYLLAGQDIFSIIHSGMYGQGLHVWVSFFEIYCGHLFDLLNRRNRLHAREDGSRQVCIAGLTETEATSVSSLVQTLEYGNSVRSKGATGVNPDSSRSHAILQLDIRNSDDIKVGKISFIDLAGSERASDVTDTDKQTRMEGAEINQSLLALKECIRSIDQDSRHTPFRQSKLTHILKDSFVGNSRTCMIANISPIQTACENTLNTLRYADRVKELKRESVRSSSVGQAMNLLMNIPPTAPSIFHPSNILSSSTPMRTNVQPRRERANVAATAFILDPTETPIRGHNLPRRTTGKDNSRNRQGQSVVQAPSSRSRIEQLSVVSPATHKVPPGTSTRSSAHATAASQGASAPPPDASPSESDQTDTDSCNVTNPTYTKVSPASHRHLPVVKSTDTEFDFPTSDFNNIDDLNDLNRSDSHQKGQIVSQESHLTSQARDDQPLSAAAASETVVSALASCGKRVVPALKPVVYRSTDPNVEIVSAGTSSPSPQMSEVNQKFHSSDVAIPQVSKNPPNFKKQSMRDLISSDESVNEEDLLADGLSSDVSPTNMNNLAVPPPEAASAVQVTKPVPVSSLINRHHMMPIPADSSDLTKFTQRSSLRPIDSSGLITGDSSKPVINQVPQTQAQADDVIHKSAAGHSRTRSPSIRTKSPNMQHNKVQTGKPPLQAAFVESPASSQSPQHQQSSRQLPWPCRQSPTTEHSLLVPSPPSFQQRMGSPHIPSSPSEDAKKTRRHSDGSDSGWHQKASQSPTGEISDDSTDSIRASLSDQGQTGHRHIKDSRKSSSRRERCDPILALNMQRKKQTLPDPQNFSKMLTRSNTPKGGLVHRDAGWKAIHSEVPSPKAGSVEATLSGRDSEASSLIAAGHSGWKTVHNEVPSHKTSSVETALSEGDCHSEPSSLIASGHEELIAEHQEHFSDGTNYYTHKTEDNRNRTTSHRSSKGKQLPQVSTSKSETDKDVLLGFHQNSVIASNNSGPPDVSVKVSSAIVTEKLSSGAVFAPIHPQPVTSVGAKPVTEQSMVPSDFLHQPTPVTAVSTQNLTGIQESMATIHEARMLLVAAHEDQLATITSLCKYEMRLLLNAKKVSGRRGFDDYLRRVSDILQQKMAAIASLHEVITTYRSSQNHNNSIFSSVATPESDMGN